MIVQNDVLYGADEHIVEMVRQRVPEAEEGFGPDAVALGVLRHGRLLGGAVFDKYGETAGHANIFVTIAFDSPAWATRRVLRELFSYPFGQLGCRRMTALVADNNHASQNIVQRLGFQPEGRLRCFFPGDIDALVFGILREECLFIRK